MRNRAKRHLGSGAAAAAVVALAAGAASAQYSSIEWPSIGGGEDSHLSVIQEIFGNTVVGQAGQEAPGSAGTNMPPNAFLRYTGVASAGQYAGSQITVTRVADTGGSDPLDLATAPAGLSSDPQANPTSVQDQVWTDGIVRARAEAVFASNTQNFGYIGRGGLGGPLTVPSVGDVDASDYNHLFTASGSGHNVSGSAQITFEPGDQWLWARHGAQNTGNFDLDGSNSTIGQTSRDADNRDQLDHMVTYHVQVAGRDLPIWLLFWEDLPGPASGVSDRDFNDLVVMLTVIPLPGPAAMGLAGLLGLAAVRRRRNA